MRKKGQRGRRGCSMGKETVIIAEIFDGSMSAMHHPQ